MLNPTKIYDSRYNLMDLKITRESGKITLSQSLYVIFDLLRWSGDCNWSFDHLFGRQIERICPLTKESSSITIHYDESERPTPEEWNLAGEDPIAKVLRYRGPGTKRQNIGISYKGDIVPNGTLPESPLLATRYITGSGQEKGTVFTVMKNTSDLTLKVTVLEVLPWYMKLYLHTLVTKCSNGSPVELHPLLYTPAVTRKNPSQLEYQIEIFPHTSVNVEYGFDMTLLRYSEYPLDPARGFDVNGARITYAHSRKSNTLVTNTMLLTLPTPDFTMPFNVIMLTSLAITLFYGFFFNLCFRRFYVPDRHAPSRIQAIINRVKRLIPTSKKPKSD